MSDLISRADAIEAVCGDCTIEQKDKCKTDGYCYEVKNLMALPSADAEQETVPTVVRVTMSDGSQYYLEHERDAIQADAVQGEWIWRTDIPIGDGRTSAGYVCSNCGKDYWHGNVFDFCPNCGAKMENKE